MLKALAALSALLAAAPAIAEPAEPDPKVAIVAELYRAYAWEAVLAGPKAPGLFDERSWILEHYFDVGLAKSILREQRCVAKAEAKCRISYLPIWGSATPAAYDLTIKATDKPAEVVVEFTNPRLQAPVRIYYDLVEAKRGWRVSNIRSGEWSLVDLLSVNP